MYFYEIASMDGFEARTIMMHNKKFEYHEVRAMIRKVYEGIQVDDHPDEKIYDDLLLGLIKQFDFSYIPLQGTHYYRRIDAEIAGLSESSG